MNTSSTIPGYKLLQQIDDSTTYTVWRARQESLDRDVAIKILKPDALNNDDEVEALLRQARAVAKLKSANIIHIYDVGQHEDTLYIVTEHVDGHPLTTLLDLGDAIPQKRALGIAASIAQALSDAWDGERILHRNLKPANIVIERGGSGVKVANLGTGGIAAETPGMIVGTPGYMSPEQASGSDGIDFTSDMYSLGAVLYHMTTGKVPFGDLDEDATLQAQIEGQLPFPQEVNPAITPPCANLIARLMMKDPKKRYSSWKNAIHDISNLADGRMVVIKPMAGPGSTIAAKGAGNRIAIRGKAPRKKIITRPTKDSVPVVMTASKGTENAPAVAPKPPAVAPADAAARAAALKRKYGKPSTPLWIKLPLTAGLFALIGWLGFTLLWQPYREAYPKIASVTAFEPEPVQPLQPQATTRPQPTPAIETPDQAAVTYPLDETAEPEYEPYAGPVDETPAAPPPTTAPEPARRQPTPQLETLKSSLVDTALTEGLDAAAQRLRQQQGTIDREQMQELSRFFSPANKPEALIASAFEDLIGKETYVNIGGRRIDFRVEAVSGETISAMVKSDRGQSAIYQPAELKVSQLPPEEQRRWLGETDKPEKAFAAAILDLSSANYAAAARQAKHCGPLADATRAFASKRIDMLLE